MTPSGRARRCRADERGQGLLSLVGALTIFFLLLLFAVQLTVALASRSAVTAAAFAAARDVAGYDAVDDRSAATVRAEQRLRSLLGRRGDDARIEWDLADPARVRVRVVLAAPTVAPAFVMDAVGLSSTDRTITVHREDLP